MAGSAAGMRYAPMLVCVAALAGCAMRRGGVALGTIPLIARDADLVGTKLLRPAATARSCRTTILGFPLGGGAGTMDEALAHVLAQDDEGNLLTDVVVREQRVVTGLYNRRCVVLRGDLGRSIRTVTLPAPPGHHGHGRD